LKKNHGKKRGKVPGKYPNISTRFRELGEEEVCKKGTNPRREYGISGRKRDPPKKKGGKKSQKTSGGSGNKEKINGGKGRTIEGG